MAVQLASNFRPVCAFAASMAGRIVHVMFHRGFQERDDEVFADPLAAPALARQCAPA
jgi:hypothetical protein